MCPVEQFISNNSTQLVKVIYNACFYHIYYIALYADNESHLDSHLYMFTPLQRCVKRTYR